MAEDAEQSAVVATEGRNIWRAFSALCMTFAAVSSAHPIYDGDAFWHMNLGRATLTEGARVFSEPAAFAAFSDAAVAPEWLWGVISYAAYGLGGERLLALLPPLFATGIALVITLLTRHVRPNASLAASATVASFALLLALSRVRLRPQLACLLLLPSFLLLAYRYSEAPTPRQAKGLGAALVASGLVWAQLHGSFVLAPALYALVIWPAYRTALPRDRQRHAWVFMGLVVALCSSAYGVDIASYIIHHSGGDAKQHINDMLRPTWTSLNPSTRPHAPVYAALVVLGLFGSIRDRRWYGRELLLACLGLLLGFTAVRFLSEGSALLVPWAAAGASSLFAALRPAWVRVLLAGVLIAGPSTNVLRTADEFGPLGQLGFAPTLVPHAALTQLAQLPRGANVLTSYSLGGVVSFFSHGHVRTYVDGRTPLYFDDTDYALSRDVFNQPHAQAVACDRYDVRAIVVDRSIRGCEEPPPGFRLVAVDAASTMYARDARSAPLQQLGACGTALLAADACREGGVLLRSEIERTRRDGAQDYARLLQAAERARCGGDAPAVLSLLTKPLRSSLWSPVIHKLRAQALLAQNKPFEAFEQLEPDIRTGDLAAFDLIAPALVPRAVPAERATAALVALSHELDDLTPGRVRALLALFCVAQGDAECVRFHGMRAALSGEALPATRQALSWLAEHHASERVRADARAWLASSGRVTPPP